MSSALRLMVRAQAALSRTARGRNERGDVPGWVMITLMTAGLVAVLWKVALGQLVDLFDRAMSSVTG